MSPVTQFPQGILYAGRVPARGKPLPFNMDLNMVDEMASCSDVDAERVDKSGLCRQVSSGLKADAAMTSPVASQCHSASSTIGNCKLQEAINPAKHEVAN